MTCSPPISSSAIRGKRLGGVPATRGPGGIHTMPERGVGLDGGGLIALRAELVTLAEGEAPDEPRSADLPQPAATTTATSQIRPLSRRRTAESYSVWSNGNARG